MWYIQSVCVRMAAERGDDAVTCAGTGHGDRADVTHTVSRAGRCASLWRMVYGMHGQITAGNACIVMFPTKKRQKGRKILQQRRRNCLDTVTHPILLEKREVVFVSFNWN